MKDIKDIEVLMAAEIVRDYLCEKDCCGIEYYDGDEVIMHTDIGYFDDGLLQLIEYLSAKVEESRRLAE